MPITHITVRGARQHNLRDINVQIPRNTLTVITGLSGSGKSSLAFDTIYAEGQRRYVETLSAYARQFLDQIERPDVDSIEGLSPAISIEQKTTSRSPRSTVGTITEIYDYLRLLYASVGAPHCPNCGRPISRQSPEQIVERILSLASGERVTIYAPVVRGRKGEFKDLLDELDQQGFRARIDGELRDLADPPVLEKRKNHTIEAVIDRVVLKPGVEKRLQEAVARSLQMANGLVLIGVSGKDDQLYSSSMACPDCGLDVPKLEPRSFSFNSTYGACPECHGLGSIYDFDPAKIITDWTKPLLEGALGPGSASQYLLKLIHLAAQKYKIDLKTPFEKLPPKQQDLLLHGPGRAEAPRTGFHGILAYLRDALQESKSEAYRDWMLNYMSATTCPACKGKRLRPASLAVKIGELSIADFTALPLRRALDAARGLRFSQREAPIAERLRREIVERLEFLNAVGLSYLALERNAATLSGGEGQRIRLATQIGSRLRGVLYVLDEPSIGLHQRDNQRLITALESLRNIGNTVLVVEHDEDTIRHADYVLDLGPGAGKLGGYVVAEGTPQDIMRAPQSLTGRYLSGEATILHRIAPRPLTGKWVTVEGARSHNLRDLTVKFPLGVMTVITGVSGSGKSTLVNDILYRALAKELYGSREQPGEHARIAGFEQIDKAIRIDQSPIGRTPRSNPATYTGVFTAIRDLFSMLPESRERGYKPGRFSFNVSGGRCEACQGEGQRRIEMNFLPDVYVLCEVCNGRRYNQETLAVKFNGYSIADVLELAIEDALPVLADIPQVRQKLQTLVDVGLGYIHLGQAATTLSGGEAQRMKLARELSKRQTGRTLYLLDEPTTGLHFDDVRKLLEVLHRLSDLGNTILIIEHNLDVVRNADWVIDLGPEGGEEGGRIIAEGTPEQVASVAGSYTGEFLRRYYAQSPNGASAVTNGAQPAPAARRKNEKESSDPMNADPSTSQVPPVPTMEAWSDAPEPPIPPRPRDIPHLGHTVLFFVIAVPMLVVGQYLSLWLAKISHLYGHRGYHALAVMMATDARLSIPSQTVAYALVAAATAVFFHMLWLMPFSKGIHWNAHQARTKFFRLLALGLVVGFGITLLGNYLPMPQNPPILMDMMKSPLGAWMMLLFGVTAAPMLEELAFRGFLLPGFVNSFRWLARKDDISPATVRWVGLPVSVVLTSIPFALLHSPQVSHAWAPLVLIGLVSVILCVVRLLLDSLAASTVVHAAYNFTLFAGILVQTNGFTHLDKLKG